MTLVNVTSRPVALRIQLLNYQITGTKFVDLISQAVYTRVNDHLNLEFNPYQIIWLKSSR